MEPLSPFEDVAGTEVSRHWEGVGSQGEGLLSVGWYMTPLRCRVFYLASSPLLR